MLLVETVICRSTVESDESTAGKLDSISSMISIITQSYNQLNGMYTNLESEYQTILDAVYGEDEKNVDNVTAEQVKEQIEKNQQAAIDAAVEKALENAENVNKDSVTVQNNIAGVIDAIMDGEDVSTSGLTPGLAEALGEVQQMQASVSSMQSAVEGYKTVLSTIQSALGLDNTATSAEILAAISSMKEQVANLTSQVDSLSAENASLKTQLAEGGDYQKGYAAGVASVDVSDNSAAYKRGYAAGVASVNVSGDSKESYDKGFAAGVASVDVSTNSAPYKNGYSAGYNAGIAANNNNSNNTTSYNNGYQAGYNAGVSSVDTKTSYNNGYNSGYAIGYSAGSSKNQNGNNSELTKQITSLTDQVNTLTTSNTSLNNEMTVLKSENSTLKSQVTGLESQISTLKKNQNKVTTTPSTATVNNTSNTANTGSNTATANNTASANKSQDTQTQQNQSNVQSSNTENKQEKVNNVPQAEDDIEEIEGSTNKNSTDLFENQKRVSLGQSIETFLPVEVITPAETQKAVISINRATDDKQVNVSVGQNTTTPSTQEQKEHAYKLINYYANNLDELADLGASDLKAISTNDRKQVSFDELLSLDIKPTEEQLAQIARGEKVTVSFYSSDIVADSLYMVVHESDVRVGTYDVVLAKSEGNTLTVELPDLSPVTIAKVSVEELQIIDTQEVEDENVIPDEVEEVEKDNTGFRVVMYILLVIMIGALVVGGYMVKKKTGSILPKRK